MNSEKIKEAVLEIRFALNVSVEEAVNLLVAEKDSIIARELRKEGMTIMAVAGRQAACTIFGSMKQIALGKKSVQMPVKLIGGGN